MDERDIALAVPFKLQAKRLRAFLAQNGVELKHRHALEAVAQMHGYASYNELLTAEISAGDVSQGLLATVISDAISGPLTDMQDQDLEAWDAVYEAQDDASTYEGYPLRCHDEALLAARIVLNRYDLHAMTSAVPYLVDFRTVTNLGYPPYREWAERLLDYIARIVAAVNADPSSWDARFGYTIDSARYSLLGLLSLGYFEEGELSGAAFWAAQAAKFSGDDDTAEMATAAPVLYLMADRLSDAASHLEGVDPAFAEAVLAMLLLSAGKSHDTLSLSADCRAVCAEALAIHGRDAVPMALTFHDGPIDSPIMDAFDPEPTVAIAQFVSGHPEIRSALQLLVGR